MYHPKESISADEGEIQLDSMDFESRQQFWLRNQKEKDYVLRRELYLQPPLQKQEVLRPAPVTTDWESAKKASMLALNRMKEQEEERKVIISLLKIIDIMHYIIIENIGTKGKFQALADEGQVTAANTGESREARDNGGHWEAKKEEEGQETQKTKTA